MVSYLWKLDESERILHEFGGKYDTRPSLPEDAWARVDALFDQVALSLVPAFFVVLTDRAAEDAARYIYVHFEPFGPENLYRGVVIACDVSRNEVSIAADC